MLLPPAKEAASSVYVIPEAFDAEDVYITEPVPKQRVDVAPSVKIGVLTDGLILIEPEEVELPQPPVKVTMYGKEPDTVGDPLIVTIPVAQVPVTPVGKPVTVAPVAPVVA